MSITVTPCASAEDLAAAINPIMHYFGGGFGEQDLARWCRIIDIPRMHAAREDGKVVGGAGAFTFEMSTVGGKSIPSGGVTVVGVLPTHRRRGVLSAMMRAQLDDVRDRGEAVAWLWASEETIYGRFGYGLASLSGDIDIPKTGTAFARPYTSKGVTRIVTDVEALETFPAVYDAVRKDTPGMPSRNADWWQLRRLADTERGRAGGAGVLNRVLLTVDGKPEAYALYRMHQSFDGGITTGFLNVIEAVGSTLEGTKGIWRFLFDVDWVSRVKAAQLPTDHPLFWLLARPRMMKMRYNDALWVRLVDIPKALAARTISAGEPVIVEVADAFIPSNSGTYRIGEGGTERTNAAPDLSMAVNALGSVYLGGFTFSQLAQAGMIEEKKAGAATRADALFPRGKAPWCPEIF